MAIVDVIQKNGQRLYWLHGEIPVRVSVSVNFFHIHPLDNGVNNAPSREIQVPFGDYQWLTGFRNTLVQPRNNTCFHHQSQCAEWQWQTTLHPLEQTVTVTFIRQATVTAIVLGWCQWRAICDDMAAWAKNRTGKATTPYWHDMPIGSFTVLDLPQGHPITASSNNVQTLHQLLVGPRQHITD